MEEAVKEFIQSYKELNAKKEILEKIRKASPEKQDDEKYAVLEIRLQIIKSCLQTLTKDEREIVSKHLIEHLKWCEIAAMCENNSERTMKRVQKNALRKICRFITENDWEQYIKTT